MIVANLVIRCQAEHVIADHAPPATEKHRTVTVWCKAVPLACSWPAAEGWGSRLTVPQCRMHRGDAVRLVTHRRVPGASFIFSQRTRLRW